MRVLSLGSHSLGSHSGFSLPRARGRSHQKGLVMNARLVFAAVAKACFFLKAGDVSVSFRIWGFSRNECI